MRVTWRPGGGVFGDGLECHLRGVDEAEGEISPAAWI